MALNDIVKAMPPEQQKGALIALDACTRPLTVREIEHALRVTGVSSSKAFKVASALRRVAVVAVVGETQ